MNDRNALQRRFRVAQRGFTKAFSFKRKNHAGRTHVKRRRSMCDDASMLSTSVLIVPSVQRLTASSPPLAMLDRIHGSKHTSIGQTKTLTLFSSARPMIQTHIASPYQSKKARKRLSATLQNYHCKPDEEHSYSAWERQQPSSLNRKDNSTWLKPISVAEGSRVVGIAITESLNSEFLPPDISPANKFVPIGHEEDDDGISFASGDFDICEKSVDECNHQHTRVDDTSMNGYSEDILQDKYSVLLENEDEAPDDPTPSPLSTEDTSSWSRESYVSTRGMGPQKEHFHHSVKSSCDLNNKDWFPNVKQEIMKLASCFTQCGATSKSVL